MATNRTVVLRGDPIINEDGRATAAIRPGHMLSGHLALTAGVSAAAALIASGEIPRQFALERDELGTGIDNTYQGEGTGSAFYASGDQVKVGVFRPGDQITALFVAGAAIADNAKLMPHTDGTLKAQTVNSHGVARTLGVVASGASIRLGRVEIL